MVGGIKVNCVLCVIFVEEGINSSVSELQWFSRVNAAPADFFCLFQWAIS